MKKGNVIFGAILPHPPIIVPEIGGENLKTAMKTVEAVKEAAKRIKGKDFDLLIVITPHGDVGQAAVPVYSGHVLKAASACSGGPSQF